MSFVSMTEAILIAIQFVSIVIIVIIMAVVANTMAMTARERIGEYAVFKTLGFGGWFIAGLIFGESLFISLAGDGHRDRAHLSPWRRPSTTISGPTSPFSSWSGRRCTGHCRGGARGARGGPFPHLARREDPHCRWFEEDRLSEAQPRNPDSGVRSPD